MIIGQDIHPQRKLYYWGAMVIDILKALPQQEAEFFEIYEKLNEQHSISVEVFSLTLDWLFILGAIEQKQERIKRCF